VSIPLDQLDVEEVPPESNGGTSSEHFRGIVADADLGEFIRRPKTQVAREYEKKTAAILNAVMRQTISNPSTVKDAAAIIAAGDGICSSAGEYAEQDEHVRKFIDLIATPANPALMFAMAIIPLVSQILRNHETEAPSVKAVRTIKVPFLKKNVSLSMKLRPKLPAKMRSFTVEPNAMMNVFDHPEVKKALKKRGIDIASPE
jgi:hypothetical protein